MILNDAAGVSLDPKLHPKTPQPPAARAGNRYYRSMRATADLPVALNDRPPLAFSALIGLQHLLAIFGGIVTAPLLIALGMGLPAEDTSYLISSALVVSGFATILQITRIGPLGSGLLSIQGTSFTFVGPLIYLYQLPGNGDNPALILGSIFAACLVCALLMACLSPFIVRLRYILTSNVAAVTVMLLGLSLVIATLGNIRFDYQQALANGRSGWLPVALAAGVFACILALSRSTHVLLRMSSIVIGLAIGLVAATALGLVDTSGMQPAAAVFVPTLLRYPLQLDASMILVLMPIFLVSATESLGDLSATASLSGLPTNDRAFYRRLRGGILADSLNSALAALFSTFPNTTFSQNNGVIRITGVCSRRIGLYVAVYLIALGALPGIASVIQVIPGSVVAGATLLMFVMVGVSGYHIALAGQPQRRDWSIIALAIGVGLGLWGLAPKMTMLPTALANFLSFPVSSGAFAAALLEWLIPKHLTERLA